MQEVSPLPRSPVELDQHGLNNLGRVYWNVSTARLYEAALRRHEGAVAHDGPFVVRTGGFTGRSPGDRYVIDEPTTSDKIWWSEVNKPYSADRFNELHERMVAYLQGRDVFVQDVWCGADPRYRMPVRFVTQYAWHSIFIRNMFIHPTPEELAEFRPEFVVLDVPGFHASPRRDELNSDVFILLNLGAKMVLIAATEYGGEMKKSIFSAMNYLLPEKNVMPMHCSANVGEDGDVAVFFGLSGTGKTTLSADSRRTLIGDDEHGWSDAGVFNFEGGCYAKMIRLSREAEPEIYATTSRFGTILENVVIDPHTRRIDLDDDTYTENTRGAYPISFIPNASETGYAGHPKNIVFLTADAFGVLPPVSKLTPEQAMYHFISGYTAKVAGTERGVTEPQATFSACFGAPFMPRHPSVYAELLGDKIAEHDVDCWLINTGWTGGPYGTGERMRIAHTRATVHAALDGTLATGEFVEDPIFGIAVPKSCPGVPDEVLIPKGTWGDPEAYDRQAAKLARMFAENFEQYADVASE
ncbi:MAG: phosphoenolpyruvate carboxykinase [Acidobacteriota bacterium]|nr:phosphoenolpyruvate carboxykinase [Acidobacteriota bacterium]